AYPIDATPELPQSLLHVHSVVSMAIFAKPHSRRKDQSHSKRRRVNNCQVALSIGGNLGTRNLTKILSSKPGGTDQSPHARSKINSNACRKFSLSVPTS